MSFTELWKRLLDIIDAIRKEAEKHKFEITKFSLNPFFIELACKRVASNDVVFYLEIARKEDGSIDFRMKDKNGNYL